MNTKYSVILGNTRDRFCGGYKENPDTSTMLARAAKIPFVKGIELVGRFLRETIGTFAITERDIT